MLKRLIALIRCKSPLSTAEQVRMLEERQREALRNSDWVEAARIGGDLNRAR